MADAALKLTLYNPETNEVEREFTRAFIPTGIFTELARMMKSIDLDHPEQLEPETIEALYALVCELFANQISIDQIKTGTDLGEFAALLSNIMARVGAVMPADAQPNPTTPGKSRQRHR